MSDLRDTDEPRTSECLGAKAPCYQGEAEHEWHKTERGLNYCKVCGGRQYSQPSATAAEPTEAERRHAFRDYMDELDRKSMAELCADTSPPAKPSESGVSEEGDANWQANQEFIEAHRIKARAALAKGEKE